MKHVSYITARVACLAVIVLLLGSGLHAASPSPDTDVIPFGASFWNYLNPQNLNQDPFNNLEGVDFDFVWFEPDYDEADLTVDDGGIVTLSWQGPAQGPIGYDVINGLPDPPGLVTDIGQPADGERYTTYLRGVPFNRPAGVGSGPFVLEFLADDGFAMYLNGSEVDLDVNDANQKRYNCCIDIGGDPVAQDFPPTFLDRSIGTGGEENYIVRELGDFSLNASNNMIAVSLHQAGTSSSDTGFDMRLFVPGNGRPWGGDFSGDWDDPTNWQLGAADSPQEFAVFDSFAGPHTIWTNTAQSLDGIQIEDDNTYNIAGTGSINLQGNGRDASLNVLSGEGATEGQHQFQVRVNLNRNTDALIEGGSSVTFNNRLNLNGNTLEKSGLGDLIVRNTDNTGTGTIDVVEGALGGGGTVAGDVTISGGSIAPSGAVTPDTSSNTLTIAGDANVSAGGATLTVYGNGDSDAISGGGSGNLSFGAGTVITIANAAGYTPADGDSAQILLDWAAINDSGATINAPGWDTSNLFVDGTISVGGVPPATCDFNGDTLCDIADIDQLTAEIATGGNNLSLDVNGDGSITIDDRDAWLASAGTKNGLSGPYLLGDATLDGAVNASDLNEMGQRWQANDNAWSHGDINADGIVNASDLNELGQRWQQVVAPAAAASAVPEPSALSLLWLAALGLFGCCRRR